MKKIFLVLTVALVVTMSNFAEAVPVTRTQFDKIFSDIEKLPVEEPTLNFNAETFIEKFNGIITVILTESMGADDAETMAPVCLIEDFRVLEKDNGELFINIFGDANVVIVGLTEKEGGNVKDLRLYYTTPEKRDESLFVVWLMMAFVKSIAPDVNPQTLMNELTAENSSGSVVKGDIEFSVADEGNLNVLKVRLAR